MPWSSAAALVRGHDCANWRSQRPAMASLSPRNFGKNACRRHDYLVDGFSSKASARKRGAKASHPRLAIPIQPLFAVALSSTPITRLGRIWADGSLLRGALGDLKVAGQLRFYSGFGDDPVDPLIAADKGSNAPAFRDCAYVVFEELELGDFWQPHSCPEFSNSSATGGDEAVSLNRLVPDAQSEPASAILFPMPADLPMRAVRSDRPCLQLIRSFPLVCTSGRGGCGSCRAQQLLVRLYLAAKNHRSLEAPPRKRGTSSAANVQWVSLQRYAITTRAGTTSPGSSAPLGSRRMGREVMIDLPATMTAPWCQEAQRTKVQTVHAGGTKPCCGVSAISTRDWSPEAVVRLPDEPGFWLIRSWEWLDRGIELLLERFGSRIGIGPAQRRWSG